MRDELSGVTREKKRRCFRKGEGRKRERESHAGRRIVAAAVGSARCSVPFRSRSGEFRGVNIANGERRAAAAPSSLPLHRAEIDRINSGSELAPSSWKPYLPLSSLLYHPRATTIASAISFPPSTPTLCRLSLSLSLSLYPSSSLFNPPFCTPCVARGSSVAISWLFSTCRRRCSKIPNMGEPTEWLSLL